MHKGDGEYNICSAYKIIMENPMDYGGLSREGDWNMIGNGLNCFFGGFVLIAYH